MIASKRGSGFAPGRREDRRPQRRAPLPRYKYGDPLFSHLDSFDTRRSHSCVDLSRLAFHTVRAVRSVSMVNTSARCVHGVFTDPFPTL